MNEKWDHLQEAVFQEVATGQGNIVVEAVAGAGKTTCLIQALSHVPADNSWLLCAFARKIAQELQNRAPSGGDVCHLHKLGLKILGRAFRRVQVDEDKIPNYISQNMSHRDTNSQKILAKVTALAKSTLETSLEQIQQSLGELGVESDVKEMAAEVQQLLAYSQSNSKVVDLDDMIYLPVILKLKVPKYDYIFVDEVQDLTNCQRAFILNLRKKKSRVIAFGDPHQAIFAFNGAPIDSMSRFKKELSAKTLYLSITYRCPQAIVREIKDLVPHLQAAATAPIGKVSKIEFSSLDEEVRPGSFIISRTNAALIPLALSLLKRKIPCNIQGKDLGEDMLDIVRGSKKKKIEDLIVYLNTWSEKQKLKLALQEKDFSFLMDKVKCLQNLALVSQDVEELISNIQKIFTDTNDKQKVILGTCHKLKGLERPDVFVLTFTFNSNSQEELNLQYVAKSRAQNHLYLVYQEGKI